ncbi:MAG: polymer-forming cytoskeletal protein [Roseinatronobacter sp.]|jgi:cytoskeletal protein CcmA (bactofilin family)|nr:polymer-forming cytoskeletal protein [Roseinatronobacter sp.]
MFSKSRINEPGPKTEAELTPAKTVEATPSFLRQSTPDSSASHVTKAKPAASVLAADLTVTGNLKTTGDIVIEGVVDGDIRAHLLTVGESATIRGEIVADDIVINGRVIGRVRGLKVRLTSSAQVEGDIIHKTIAIESGAHFEGSVQRQDDPLQTNRAGAAAPKAPEAASAPSFQPRPEASDAIKKAAEAKKSIQG